MITATGGCDGVRDIGMLDSALNAPLASFGGQDVYPTLEQKAVRLGYGLIRNHPFADGNKRTGTLAMLLVLKQNGVGVQFDHQELTETILRVAAGEMTEEEFAAWVHARIAQKE